MQGASPLASPRLNPRGTGSTCRCRRLNGGRAPGVAGSASVSGTRRGLAFFVARRPHLSLAFLPLSPRPPSQWEGGDQGYFMQGASPFASPGIDRARHWLCLRETGSSGVAGGHLLCRCQLCLRSIHNREKFLGVWGLLSRSPQRLSRFSRPSPSFPAVHRRTQGETANCTKMRKTVDIERVYWYNGGGKGRVPCSAPAERDAGRVRKG